MYTKYNVTKKNNFYIYLYTKIIFITIYAQLTNINILKFSTTILVTIFREPKIGVVISAIYYTA